MRPRSGEPSGRRSSACTSIRETKKLATEAMALTSSPASTRSLSAAT
jgi:hypothetical protein